MSRTSKILTAGVLAIALGVLAVPVGMNLAPVFGPAPATATLPELPAAQQLPTALSTVSGINPLSSNAPVPDGRVLSKALDATLMDADGGNYTALVQDAATGQILYSRNASAGRLPASNLKLLTAAAALKTLGAQTRLSTKVLAGAGTGSIVLRAGGDVLLGEGQSEAEATVGHAGVATLAARTATALESTGAGGPVRITVDDTLFTGPALNPAWLQGDVVAGEIAPVFPMALYGARLTPDASVGARPQDSAMSVAAAFAAALKAAGVDVDPDIQRGKADDGARTLAEVSSATVGEQIEYMLQDSDNYVAETLGRLSAVALKRVGSSAGASEAVKETVAALGVKTDSMVLADCSGLAADDRVSAEQLTQTVKIMLADTTGDLRQGLLGLPIAGLSGTLGQRYMDPGTVAGAGLVRAKTGTLNAVISLSGYVVDTDGRLLVFSFIGNDLNAGSAAAKPVIDAAATILAGCGCGG
ncbi:D-alanyl-D-alanine carboxypeptidase/D-alanyl-D-alanine endopeptidase [Arthrobacter sp. A5]|uniref:D-alanyl-D-alanine carboxypeptidase/D-alanyl-D-alanine endopeptidase n=1 Tax=Arthrobacter sp. A5 TaxID=576926 RepID=UPI003DA8F083